MATGHASGRCGHLAGFIPVDQSKFFETRRDYNLYPGSENIASFSFPRFHGRSLTGYKIRFVKNLVICCNFPVDLVGCHAIEA